MENAKFQKTVQLMDQFREDLKQLFPDHYIKNGDSYSDKISDYIDKRLQDILNKLDKCA